MRRLLALVITVTLVAGVAVALAAEPEPAADVASGGEADDGVRNSAPLPSHAVEGENLIRLMTGAFDPLDEGMAPVPEQIPPVRIGDVPDDVSTYWLVQAEGGDFAGADAAIARNGGAIAGFVPDAAYIVRATKTQIGAMTDTDPVRAATLYQPGYKVPTSLGDYQALLDLEGEQSFRVYVFETEPDPGAVRSLVAQVPGTSVTAESDRVVDVRATTAQVPAIAGIIGVEWIELTPELRTMNAQARWVNDTGERDEYMATAPGRLTGAGQTAAVADTDVNYLPDFSSGAQSYFRDCEDDDGETGELGDGQSGCVVARYTQAHGGNSTESVQDVVDHGTDPRKVVAYFDIGDTEGISGDPSNHGTHTAGSVVGDTDRHGTWDRQDGMAPGAMLVHQNIGTSDGGLSSPVDDYQLWAQAYRPSDPASVSTTYDPSTDTDHYDVYDPLEDARTHNNSYGLVAPIVDLGNAAAADEFVWEHEDMVIVASAGNEGPGPASISAPSIGKNVVTSGASANGRQPMASIDSMAVFSSHGPSVDNRYEVDLVTPGQIVIGPKGGTADEEQYLQGTSMSGPILTGLATLVREYFWEGYGPGEDGGFAVGDQDETRRHNPSAALVRATLVNGADRMRGRYSGDDGEIDAQDGQYPSAGQGFGLVNLENSLYFADGEGPASQQATWYHDVWRADEEAFGLSVGGGLLPIPELTQVRDYPIEVAAGTPFSVSMVFTDAPNSPGAGGIVRTNDLTLVVEDPEGNLYYGNNFNTRLDPGADEWQSVAGPNPDSRNLVERVRIPDVGEQAGTWTIHVYGMQVVDGPQGFALAASGDISEALPEGTGTLVADPGFTPAGPPRQADVAGDPTIVGEVRVTSVTSDTARVEWETNEPTTGVVLADDERYIDSYNLNATTPEGDPENEPGYEGIEEGPVETSDAYADRPVVSTHHEVLVTGLTGDTEYELTVRSYDLAGGRPEDNANDPEPEEGNVVETTAPLWSTNAVIGARALDMAQLTQAPTDELSSFDPITGVGDGVYGTSTQMYAGQSGGNGYLGAFMFRVPDTIDPDRILGATVEMTSGHDITSHYSDDTRLFVDLLPETHEPIQTGGPNYTSVHDAPAEARAYPEVGYRRGGGKTYDFDFACQDLDALRETLSGEPTEDGEQLASFRFDAMPTGEESLFSMDIGFNRRSRGADLRPRLVLYLEGQTDGQADAPTRCEGADHDPVITDVGVQPGVAPPDAEEGDPGSVVVSWRTDVPSDSTVFFRPTGSSAAPTQVGSNALTTVHAVQVFGLDPDTDYAFGVRSRTCNDRVTNDDNDGDGYDFGPVSGEEVAVPPPPTIEADQFFFHDPQTFDESEPADDTENTQQSPGLADPDTARDPSSIWWAGAPGDLPRDIDGDVTFDWWYSTTNPLGAGDVRADVTLFADPDDFDDDTEAIIGRETVDLPADLTATQVATIVEDVFTGDNPIDDELVIQVSPFYVDTGPLLTAHYDATSTPSSFSIPVGAQPPDEGEPDENGLVTVAPHPAVGPKPAQSADDNLSIDNLATRDVPTDGDVAAGTARCAPVASTTAGEAPELPPPPPPPAPPTEVQAGNEVRGRGPDEACTADFVPDPRFQDTATDVHQPRIWCIAWYLVTLGTGDADRNGRQEYEPGEQVTREQMASFIARLAIEGGLTLPSNPPDRFDDDEASIHERSINAGVALGLILGKGDIDGDGREEFEPTGLVTRGQMAAFIARVHQQVIGSLPTPSRDYFEDDDGTTHAASIGALAELGVVQGVGDTDGDGRQEFDPDGFVTRGQMATFIANELALLVESGAAEPGGAEVVLDGTTVADGADLTGDIATHKVVGSLTADGCGLDDAPVTVAADKSFSVRIPAGQAAGPCELALRAVTNRAGETGPGQSVTWLFDVTVT